MHCPRCRGRPSSPGPFPPRASGRGKPRRTWRSATRHASPLRWTRGLQSYEIGHKYKGKTVISFKKGQGGAASQSRHRGPCLSGSLVASIVHCSVGARRAPGARAQTGVKTAGTGSVRGGRSCVIPARTRRVWAGSMPRVNSMEPGGCPGVTVEVVLEVSGTLRRASSGQGCGGKGQDASRCAGY